MYPLARYSPICCNYDNTLLLLQTCPPAFTITFIEVYFSCFGFKNIKRANINQCFICSDWVCEDKYNVKLKTQPPTLFAMVL